jgi:hypothetical protein
MAEGNSITVFLSQCGAEQLPVRTELEQVLKSAGMRVIPDSAQFDAVAAPSIASLLPTTNCSVHILYPQYSPVFADGISAAKFQFQEAKKHLEQNPNFKSR